VLVVILLFLQDWRAMLMPATTVPVTIIGAFAAMAALGFTVNLIHAVRDRAGHRHRRRRRHRHRRGCGAQHRARILAPHDASIKAMDELFGPIIGITLVLMSVFIPAAFMPGLTGKMYAQFALVIAATALLSAVNAATLKPAQPRVRAPASGAG
jgi:HAE1 family hydrophobic/amphiphilic exporter-1